MDLKAKIAAAASRGNIGPEKGKYTKSTTPSSPNSNKPYMKTITDKPQVTPKVYNSKIESVKTVKRTPMSPMPTLKPTSVSVSVEKRTAAPLAGNSTMGKTKGRRG